MRIDLWTALRYPFAFGNLRRVWLVPSVVLMVVQILIFFMSLSPEGPLRNAVQYAQFGIFMPFNFLLCGFLWTMTGTLHESGKTAGMPSWRESWLAYLFRGFKLFIPVSLYAVLTAFVFGKIASLSFLPSFIVFILLTIWDTVTVFFLMVVIVESAHTYRFLDLWRFHRPVICFRQYFTHWLVACLFTVLTLALYLLVLQLANGLVGFVFNRVEIFDVLVLPLAIIPMIVTIWHIWNQPFLPEAEESDGNN